METLSTLSEKILQLLSTRYNSSFTLEELRNLINPISRISKTSVYYIFAERKDQALLMDALILLNDQGYIFLDSVTDESCITLKGLIKIDSKVYCN